MNDTIEDYIPRTQLNPYQAEAYRNMNFTDSNLWAWSSLSVRQICEYGYRKDDEGEWELRLYVQRVALESVWEALS